MPDEIAQIVSILGSCGGSVSEKTMEEIKNIMNRSQIEKKYKNKIKQLPDGRYFIYYDGNRIMRKSPERVVDKIFEIENEKGERTLDSIAKEFFKYRHSKSSSGTYGKDISNYENYIKGTEIATKDITKITLVDGIKWADHCLSKKTDMKEKYFKNVRGTLNQMFQYAKINGWILRNPVEAMDIHRDHFTPATRHQDRELVFFDEERFAVCSLAREDATNTGSALPLAIPLLFATGLRDGELCALKWRDIEPKGIHVQSEMVEYREEDGKFKGYKYVGHTKTKAGDRIIPMNKEVTKILADVKKWNSDNNLPTEQDDFIFLRFDNKGNPSSCTTRCFETRIKKYCKQADMETLKSQHDARRTFATNLFHKGMNPKEIQKLMGHESLEQTMDYIKQKEDDESVLEYLETLSTEDAVAV